MKKIRERCTGRRFPTTLAPCVAVWMGIEGLFPRRAFGEMGWVRGVVKLVKSPSRRPFCPEALEGLPSREGGIDVKSTANWRPAHSSKNKMNLICHLKRKEKPGRRTRIGARGRRAGAARNREAPKGAGAEDPPGGRKNTPCFMAFSLASTEDMIMISGRMTGPSSRKVKAPGQAGDPVEFRILD